MQMNIFLDYVNILKINLVLLQLQLSDRYALFFGNTAEMAESKRPNIMLCILRIITNISMQLDWLQSLKHFFINLS